MIVCKEVFKLYMWELSFAAIPLPTDICQKPTEYFYLTKSFMQSRNFYGGPSAIAPFIQELSHELLVGNYTFHTNKD